MTCKILTASNITEMEKQINKYLVKGYILQGNITTALHNQNNTAPRTDSHYYTSAMKGSRYDREIAYTFFIQVMVKPTLLF